MEEIDKAYNELIYESNKRSPVSIFFEKYVSPVFHLVLIGLLFFSIYVAFFGL
ncbi:MAG: hypothetical protein [Cryophage ML09]|nr:MAG: hypothetical protein [Cryophage ML09]